MENINLIEILQAEWNRLDTEESEEHKHITNEIGDSGLWHCNLLDSLHWAEKDLPETEGIKAEKGGLLVGKWDHKILGNTLNKYFQREAEKYPDLKFADEVYIRFEIIPGLFVLSPIDYAAATAPGFIKQTITFKNITIEANVLHPDATLVKLWDFKTAGNFGFYKMLEEGLPDGYRAQFHGYMFPAGLKELDTIVMHKAKARLYILKCKWDDLFWQEILKKQHRKIELTDLLKNKGTQFLKRTDLECYCDSDSIAWYSCPLSSTFEETNRWGEPKLKLKCLCKPAEEFFKKDALKKFRPGQLWLRGLSHVTINAIRGDLILSTNKGGSEFKDTLRTALKKFSPLKGQQYSQQELLF